MALKTLRTLLVAAGFILASFGLASSQAILVDHVDGINPDGNIDPVATLTFHMRVIGDETNHLMMNNGFTFASPVATWSGISVEFNPAYPLDDWFDFVKWANVWSSGSIEDTVGIGLLSLFGTGLPAGFDDILFTITVHDLMGGEPSPFARFVLDSSWYPPTNPWMWDVVGENVDWGGPYVYAVCPCEGFEPVTYCEPQPTRMKYLARVLYVYIVGEDPDEVIFESIRVQGKIPPYEPVFVEYGEIVTSVDIMRFLGASGFRPIHSDFVSTYTVEYDKSDGTHPILTGRFELCAGWCEVDASDSQATLDNIVFMADYFWRGGNIRDLEDAEIQVMLDMDGNGQADPRDVVFLIQRAGL